MINCISNRLRNRSQEVHTQLGIGSAQGKILNYVLVESEAHSVYQKDLEREFGLRPSTVTEMLNALEQKKLIQRVSDEWDGRYKKIVFTEKARSMKDRRSRRRSICYYRESRNRKSRNFCVLQEKCFKIWRQKGRMKNECK